MLIVDAHVEAVRLALRGRDGLPRDMLHRGGDVPRGRHVATTRDSRGAQTQAAELQETLAVPLRPAVAGDDGLLRHQGLERTEHCLPQMVIMMGTVFLLFIFSFPSSSDKSEGVWCV